MWVPTVKVGGMDYSTTDNAPQVKKSSQAVSADVCFTATRRIIPDGEGLDLHLFFILAACLPLNCLVDFFPVYGNTPRCLYCEAHPIATYVCNNNPDVVANRNCLIPASCENQHGKILSGHSPVNETVNVCGWKKCLRTKVNQFSAVFLAVPAVRTFEPPLLRPFWT
jgi:hypothetical protein